MSVLGGIRGSEAESAGPLDAVESLLEGEDPALLHQREQAHQDLGRDHGIAEGGMTTGDRHTQSLRDGVQCVRRESATTTR